MRARMLLVFLAGFFTYQEAFTAQIDMPKTYVAARVSSADTSGGNNDRTSVEPGRSHVVADIKGAGRIVHMWFTINAHHSDYLKTTRLKIYWDGREEPSVDVPFGDFHGLGHGLIRRVQNAYITVVARPHLNHNLRLKEVGGFNSYFPMPYSTGAKIVIENASDQSLSSLYYQIDYQKWAESPSPLRFHARYRRTPPGPEVNPDYPLNPEGKLNHVILDTKGQGHYLGVVLSVDALGKGWWEGDDMIFVDGERVPSIRGTGSEDYFCGAWGFRHEYNMPHHGISVLQKMPDREDWQAGMFSVYRFHEKDPIPFEKSIRVTIERGHANSRRDCPYSSVAYWYQSQ